MGNSNSSSKKITAQDRAILDLKHQRDTIHQYQKKLIVLTNHETSLARQALADKNRRAALLALRRKKYQETLLARTDTQLAQLEKLVMDVEFAAVQKDVVFGLKAGTEVLKEIRKEMGGLEGVEKIIGQSEEEKEYQREIEGLLEGKMSRSEEEEVEDELENLENVQSRREKAEAPPTQVVDTNAFPAAPKKKVVADSETHDPRLPDAPTEEPRQEWQNQEETEPDLVPA
ncbi:MAG: Vacuolar protein sorting-associated protein 20 [Alyxoria varia]|nr:MAG: Vacuolar protein sorting-associated protein 20 [Alyxoria varia]